jgi:hypothetical protein
LTNADMQALWWYPEKDLYAKMGGRESRDINVDYADALQDLARRHGISEEAITRAMGTVDRRSRRSGATDVGRGVGSIWRGSERIAKEEAGGRQKEALGQFRQRRLQSLAGNGNGGGRFVNRRVA